MKLTDFENVISADRLLLVDFFASWCGPCRVMHPVIDAFIEKMAGEVDLMRLDVDDHNSRELVEHYRVMSVPTLILFRGSRILWRHSGVISIEKMMDVIHHLERIEAYY